MLNRSAIIYGGGCHQTIGADIMGTYSEEFTVCKSEEAKPDGKKSSLGVIRIPNPCKKLVVAHVMNSCLRKTVHTAKNGRIEEYKESM